MQFEDILWYEQLQFSSVKKSSIVRKITMDLLQERMMMSSFIAENDIIMHMIV